MFEEMGGNQSRDTPLEYVPKNFKKGYNGDYGVKLTPNKLRTLCELDWPAFGLELPPEGLIDKIVINEVYRVIIGNPGYLDQFPYIDCGQDTVLSWPAWLRPCLEETYRIMVPRVATTSKYMEKSKEPVLAEEPEKMPPAYVPLYPPSSAPLPLTLGEEA
jgi:hypothetical protein